MFTMKDGSSRIYRQFYNAEFTTFFTSDDIARLNKPLQPVTEYKEKPKPLENADNQTQQPNKNQENIQIKQPAQPQLKQRLKPNNKINHKFKSQNLQSSEYWNSIP